MTRLLQGSLSPEIVEKLDRMNKNSVTKGVILAAGRGSRMGRLTADKPKSLFEVDRKPLIETQIEAIRQNDIAEIGIVTGYKSELLSGYGSVQFFNDSWSETQMVSSLECASEWLEDSNFIVSYSDIFYSQEAVGLLVDQDAEIAITYDKNWLEHWSERFCEPLSDAESFSITSDGFLHDIGRKGVSLNQINGQFMGLLYFSSVGWSKIQKLRAANTKEKNRLQDMTNLLQQAITSGKLKVKAVAYSGMWGELDTPDDLAIYAHKKRFVKHQVVS